MSTGLERASSCSLFHPPPTFPRGRSCSHQRKPRTFSSAVRTGGSTNKEQKLVFFQLLSSMAGREKGQEEPKPRNFPLGRPWWFHFNKQRKPTFAGVSPPRSSSQVFLFTLRKRQITFCLLTIFLDAVQKQQDFNDPKQVLPYPSLLDQVANNSTHTST